MARFLRLTAVVLVVAAAWLLLVAPPPPAQPAAFNHSKHGELACAVCHRGAVTAARAGLPEPSLCLKCHATPPGGAASALWEDAARGRPMGWVQVTRVADHVMFSHRRHVALSKLDCTSCHADVGRGATPPAAPPVRLDMDACLACHQREGASQDCAACHR